MKKHSILILSLLFCIPTIASAAPKIATIDISKVLAALNSFKKDTEIYRAAQQELEKNPRKIALDETAKKIQTLRDSRKTYNPDSDDFKLSIENEKIAVAEYRGLAEEWYKFQQIQVPVINEVMIKATSKRVKEVMATASQIAEAEGFDWVLETSGKTNSKMPVVLYLKESTDLTDKVIAELNKGTDTE